MDWNQRKREDVKIVADDLAEVLAQTVADYERRSGKVLQPAHIERLIINTYAYRETLLRRQINEAYRQQHPRFATGLMLDLCGDDVNTPRLAAQAAQTTLRFTAAGLDGAQRIEIPAGTAAAAGSAVFAVSEAGYLNAARSSIELPAVCTAAGSAGNGWSVGQINRLTAPLHPTIDVRVANTTVSAGGTDMEDDAAYRERILLAPESFSAAGPVGAYAYFARQVSPAVADVHVANAAGDDGRPVGGTVAVTVLAEYGLPSQELLAAVAAALNDERRRPLCDTVSVRAPAVVDYRLDAVLTLYTGADPVRVSALAQAAWAEYENRRRGRLGADIVPLEIRSVLKVEGVYNVETPNLTLTPVQADQWARCTAAAITLAEETADG